MERSTLLNPSSARNANNFLFNPKAVTRSSVMMKSIIEERKIRSSNLNTNTAPINRSSTEILNESKVDSNASEIERLKKEYFKIVSTIINIYRMYWFNPFSLELIVLYSTQSYYGLTLKIEVKSTIIILIFRQSSKSSRV